MVNPSDELLQFVDDAEGLSEVSDQPWRVLVVDDDGEVHQATRFALSNVQIMGRPLVLVHAYSAAEAEVLLRQMPDTAVVLLDVVMEADDSGLCLIDLIRDDLAYQPLRIILRTGQPGLAPEAALVARYDIHDYMLKTDVSRERLMTSLTTALRTYAQLEQMGKLKQQIKTTTDWLAHPEKLSTPTALAQAMVKHCYHFDLKPILVVWQAGADPTTVVAADGEHTSWIGHPLVNFVDEPLALYADQVIEKQARMDDVLLIASPSWRLLVVFHETVSVMPAMAESWQLMQALVRLYADRLVKGN